MAAAESSCRTGRDGGQRRAVEEIVAGVHGGPWEVLARFVSDSLPTRKAPIRIADAAGRKAVTVAGLLDGAVEAIRGRNRAEPVTFANIYNKIHDSTQVIARGSARYDDGEILIDNEGSAWPVVAVSLDGAVRGGLLTSGFTLRKAAR